MEVAIIVPCHDGAAIGRGRHLKFIENAVRLKQVHELRLEAFLHANAVHGLAGVGNVPDLNAQVLPRHDVLAVLHELG